MRLRRPSQDAIERYLDEQRGLAFSYPEVGATRDAGAPAGYHVDRNRRRVGAGPAAFLAACAGVRRWAMFPRWISVYPHVPIAERETVAILLRVGLWWLSAARIVYVIDEPRRFGFAYGTLPGHAECGEERFLVEHAADDSVWYGLHAFSRPRHWAARLGHPATRALQQRFARDSIAALAAAAG